MAKNKLIFQAFMILGFVLFLFGTVMLLLGAMRNNEKVLLMAFIPLGLGLLDYIVLIIIILIKIRTKKD